MKVVSVYSRRLGIINQVNASLAERSIVPRECAIDRAHLRRGLVFRNLNQVNASLAERSIVPRECATDRAHLRDTSEVLVMFI